jgi:dipeptidase E
MNIVAIGGGSVGTGETASIDQELIHLTGKRGPRGLFIPTASDDSSDYVDQVRFGYSLLGCSIDSLLLWSSDNAISAARKIAESDLIYVGGGNTKKMLELWLELGIEKMLKRHLDAGKPVGGLSAGALCWFNVCNSDWPQYEGIPDLKTAPLQCLKFVNLSLCPHASRETFRLGDYREMMRDVPGPGLALDDCCAVQIRDNEYRILGSMPGAVAHLIQWKDGILHEKTLSPWTEFRPLEALNLAAG